MDIKIYETLNGGDIIYQGKDLAVVDGFGNMPYLAMFGGNIEADTPTVRITSEQAFDFWGNSFLDKVIRFNSLTERALQNNALTSAGRIQIEQAVKKDLDFMSDFADVSVEVTLPWVDTVRIYIVILELSNLQKKEFIYLWDGSELELEDSTPSRPVVLGGIGAMTIGYDFLVY